MRFFMFFSDSQMKLHEDSVLGHFLFIPQGKKNKKKNKQFNSQITVQVLEHLLEIFSLNALLKNIHANVRRITLGLFQSFSNLTQKGKEQTSEQINLTLLQHNICSQLNLLVMYLPFYYHQFYAVFLTLDFTKQFKPILVLRKTLCTSVTQNRFGLPSSCQNTTWDTTRKWIRVDLGLHSNSLMPVLPQCC